jgi:cation:H+ antiporter
LAGLQKVIYRASALSFIARGFTIVGLLYRPETRVFKTVGWVSLGLFAIYLLNSMVLYLANE